MVTYVNFVEASYPRRNTPSSCGSVYTEKVPNGLLVYGVNRSICLALRLSWPEHHDASLKTGPNKVICQLFRTEGPQEGGVRHGKIGKGPHQSKEPEVTTTNIWRCECETSQRVTIARKHKRRATDGFKQMAISRDNVGKRRSGGNPKRPI